MYDRILIAMDGSALASKGVAHDLALAKVHYSPVSVVISGDSSPFQMAYDNAQGIQDMRLPRRTSA